MRCIRILIIFGLHLDILNAPMGHIKRYIFQLGRTITFISRF